MKKVRIKFLALCLALVSLFVTGALLTACGGGSNSEDGVTKYALSYSRGAYVAQGEVPETAFYAEGETITLAPADTFAFSGYTFVGWSDGDQVYEGGATYTMPAHDVKLRAEWVLGDANAPTVTPLSVSFEGADFVFRGSVTNVESLYIYLSNTYVEASNANYVQAEISGSAFTARLPLATLISYNKTDTPFNLRYKVDSLSSNVEGVAQGTMSLSQTYKHSEYEFRLAVNSGSGCVAVYYKPAPDETVVVTAASVAFEEEYFVVTGSVSNVRTLSIYLINTNVSASKDNCVAAEISGSTFTARLPLASLIEYDVASNIPFNLRYRANDSKVNVNIGQGTMDLSQTHTYGGKVFRLGLNNSCVAVYYTPAPVVPEPGEPDYTVSVSSMYFQNGKFIVEGACGADVEKLIFHLHNTGSPVINVLSESVIENGRFKAEFVLSEVKRVDGSEPPATYINVRYELNDDGYNSLNLVPVTNGDYTVGQKYRYGEKTWELKADSNRTYLNWSAVTDQYRLTEVSLALVDEKPVLTIAGTTAEAIEAAQLKLLLDKTMGTKEQKYIENTETEAGKFRFTVELTDLIASDAATAANAQQAYFIRLYNGSTKLADINSTWASDLLWERGQIETADAVYFLMKNTEWSNTSWNTLGICKFDR